MRYQFYREHKYVSAALNDVERQIARTDFRNSQEVQHAFEAFEKLAEMLRGHAEYENDRIHPLLTRKNSKVHVEAEQEHAHQEEQIKVIQELFDDLENLHQDDDKVAKGYQLYLTFRKFVADNLYHLHEEETKILPELQKLYSDAELRQVEADTYHHISADEMVEMLQVLFPHMNRNDREAFLEDIHALASDKLELVLKKFTLS